MRSVSEAERSKRRRSEARRPGRGWFGGDRGGVTAEFAAVLPAVAVLLAASLVGLQVAGEQVRLQDATADAARSLSRGDGAAVASARLGALMSGATFVVMQRGDLVCVDARAPSAAAAGVLFGLEVRASGCALDGGR